MKTCIYLISFIVFSGFKLHAFTATPEFLKCFDERLQPLIDSVEECNRRTSETQIRCANTFTSKSELVGDKYITYLTVFKLSQEIPGVLGNGTPMAIEDQETCYSSADEIRSSTLDFKSTLQDQYKEKPGSENKCLGSIIDYSKGTVSEYVPIAGTDFELFYSSEYNRYLPMNSTIDETFHRALIGSFATRMRILAAGQPLEEVPWVTTINYNRVVSGAFGLQEETSFIKRYQYDYIIEQFDPGTGGSGCSIRFYIDPVTNYLRWETVACGVAMGSWLPVSQGPFKSILLYKPEVWGLNGWTPSTHHYLDVATSTVFTGFGNAIKYKDITKVNLPDYGEVYLAIDRNSGNEFYVFGQDGKHLETRDTIWNKPIRKFVYNNNRIIKIINRFAQETIFNYDSQNQLTSITSPNGLTTQITIQNDKITQISNPLGDSNLMTYGSNSELITFKSLNEEITTFNYDSVGKLLNETKNSGLFQGIKILTDGVIKTFQFYHKNFSSRINSSELPTTAEPNYSQLSYIEKSYDSEGRLISTRQSYLNEAKQITYMSDQVVSKTMGFDPYWGRDLVSKVEIQRKISTLGPDFLEKSSFEMNRNYLNFKDFEKNGGGRDLFFSGDDYLQIDYNKIEKKITYSFSTGDNVEIQLNEFHDPVEISQSGGFKRFLEYDSEHRLKKISVGEVFENYSYDQYGYLSRITTSSGQVTIFVNDALGRIREKILPNQDKILIEYTAGGNIKKIVVPNSQSGDVHNFEVGIGDYLNGYLTSDNKNTYYEYDSDKRLIKVAKPNGDIKLNYKLNSSNIESIEIPTGIRELNEIDELGRLKKVKSEDKIGLEIKWAGNAITEQKWFDEDGSILATLSYTFQNKKLSIKSVSLDGEEFANFSPGLLSADGLINNRIECMKNSFEAKCSSFQDDFNSVYHTTKDENDSGILKKASLNFSRSVNGIQLSSSINLVRNFYVSGEVSATGEYVRFDSFGENKAVTSVVPEYDVNNRMIAAVRSKVSSVNGIETENSTMNSSYSYPQFSNNNVKEYRHNNRITQATHNQRDQLTKLSGSINRDYEYGDDGELKSMTNCFGKTQYEYDILGNLKKVVFSDTSGEIYKVIEYKVDGLNRRVKKMENGSAVEYYIWYDDLRIAAVLDGNKQAKVKYIYAQDSRVASLIIKNGRMYKIIHEPGLDSVSYVIDIQSKEVVQEIEYDESGNLMNNTNLDFQPLGYAGGLYDKDTKLVRFGARDYDPTTGRWTTKDPIGFAGGDTNLYAYVGGDPMTRIDPNGKFWTIAIGAAIGAVSNAKDAYNAKLSNRQILLSAILGAGTGALAGSGVGIVQSALLAGATGFFNNAGNQIISNHHAPLNLQRSALAGIHSLITGGIGAGLVSVSNKLFVSNVSESIGLAAGTALSFNIDSGVTPGATNQCIRN